MDGKLDKVAGVLELILLRIVVPVLVIAAALDNVLFLWNTPSTTIGQTLVAGFFVYAAIVEVDGVLNKRRNGE